jgi:hypothetical protein
MVAVLEKMMEVNIFHNETAQDVMEQLRFILMEFGVKLEVKESDKESTTYKFSHALPLEKPDE